MHVDAALMREIRAVIYGQLATAWEHPGDNPEFQKIPVMNGRIPTEYLPGGEKYPYPVNHHDKKLNETLVKIDEVLLTV